MLGFRLAIEHVVPDHICLLAGPLPRNIDPGRVIKDCAACRVVESVREELIGKGARAPPGPLMHRDIAPAIAIKRKLAAAPFTALLNDTAHAVWKARVRFSVEDHVAYGPHPLATFRAGLEVHRERQTLGLAFFDRLRLGEGGQNRNKKKGCDKQLAIHEFSFGYCRSNFTCPLLDQRGGYRPLDGNLPTDGIARCDIGAVEVPEAGFSLGSFCAALAAVGLLVRSR